MLSAREDAAAPASAAAANAGATAAAAAAAANAVSEHFLSINYGYAEKRLWQRMYVSKEVSEHEKRLCTKKWKSKSLPGSFFQN